MGDSAFGSRRLLALRVLSRDRIRPPDEAPVLAVALGAPAAHCHARQTSEGT